MMPLLLAIEPDAGQAGWLREQVCAPLGVELVVTDSVDQAVKGLDERLPDLILTSLLLSPRDESKLQAQLRLLDAKGNSVQTLVIPVLGTSAPKARGGMLSRLRGRSVAPADAACDPSVFRAQIAEYLGRPLAPSTSRPATRGDGVGHEPVSPPTPVASATPLRQADERSPKEESVHAVSGRSSLLGLFNEPISIGERLRPEPGESVVTTRQAVADQKPAADSARLEREREPHANASDEEMPEREVFLPEDRAWRPHALLAYDQDAYDADALIDFLETMSPRGREPASGPIQTRTSDGLAVDFDSGSFVVRTAGVLAVQTDVERLSPELLAALRRDIDALRTGRAAHAGRL